ncbi:MAG: copper resistance CopC family protein [Micromonosporaceae bacterium]
MWLAVPVLLGGVLLGGGPAYAHVELTSSTPADGAALRTAPSEVVLTFSGDINPELTEAAVTVDGKSAGAGPATVKGATVTVPLPGDEGDYRVAYRVVATDGHRVDGELRFTAAAPAGNPDSSATSAPGSPSDAGETARAASPSPAVKARTVTRSWVWLLIGLGGVGLVGALAYVLISGRKRPEDVPSSADTDPSDRDGGHREAD